MNRPDWKSRRMKWDKVPGERHGVLPYFLAAEQSFANIGIQHYYICANNVGYRSCERLRDV